jgi:hypothetical protein
MYRCRELDRRLLLHSNLSAEDGQDIHKDDTAENKGLRLSSRALMALCRIAWV